MLDTDTKRRIDACRDILVGKVPDPKSQVEQITIAMIYKFMDDMDRQSEELGGIRSFFIDEFEQYAWTNLLAPNMGGQDTLNLYSEAIGKMTQNTHLPALFRDIFKNAYLPYRGPETLRSFLKEINAFSYDHSEKLGDAFEYLLAVLGSQGDAGQFRTPRHIIDFVVQVINPQKNESILDPACGTAGFLISAWKHILENNTDTRSGDLLSIKEKQKLASSICGYDISPDMVRLSLVNLYLHGFANPRVSEYDTLTSEDNWHDYFDVILANPPFMSPKGGIKPHKRFSIAATRSEVLFVDYIAEHLNPNGRAGIIVPEGIIFQSGTAYKKLREMLVKQSLVAVISLPAGVFNPYSGVKTSVLVLDKKRHKQTDKVLFVKINNNGFGLGAQRRAVENSDLPTALALLNGFFEQPNAEINSELAHLVSREKIGETGDYHLSGERYLVGQAVNTEYPMVKLGDVCDLFGGYAFKSEELIKNKKEQRELPVVKIGNLNKDGKLDVVGAQYVKYQDYLSKYLIKKNDILIAMTGATVGKVACSKIENALLNQRVALVRSVESKVYQLFLYVVLLSEKFYQYCQSEAGGGAQGNISPRQIQNYCFPLPPLEVQSEIVAEIEGYQKIIDGARQVIENYKPRIHIQDDWEVVRLEALTEVITDGDHQPPPKVNEGVPFITISNIKSSYCIDFSETYFVPKAYYEGLKEYKKPRKGDILYTVTGSYGIPVFIDFEKEFCFQRHIGLIRPKNLVQAKYLFYYFQTADALKQGHEAATGVAQKTVALGSLRNFLIPLPDLATQQAIVAEIEAEQALVNANKALIERFEAKIKTVIGRVWGTEKSQGDDNAIAQ
jgi:type I restriction enzyme M protein